MRPLTRRRVLRAGAALGASAAIAGSTAACGASRRRDELVFGFHGDTVSIGIFRQIVALYRRKNPGSRISYTYADPSGFFRRLPLMFRAGTAPDVMIVAESWVSGLSELNAYADLASFIRRDGVDEGQWVPGALNPARIGDQVLCLPLVVYPKGVTYNKTLLDKLGIGPPQDGWRERDFVEMATEATSGSGTSRTWGMRNGFADPLIYDVPTVHGGLPFDPVTRKMTATDDRMASSFRLMYDLVRTRRVMPAAGRAQYAAGFSSGLFAMDTFLGYSLTSLNQQIGDRFEWGVAPYPKEWRGTFQSNNVAIFEGSKRKQEAWHFARFMATDPDAQRLLGPLGTPALRTAFKGWRRSLSASDRALPWDHMIEGMGQQVVAFQGGLFNKVWDLLKQQVEAMEARGVPVDEVLRVLQERGTQILRA
ncbi:ABC transporter substrate-binding protein [Streptomyces purpurascens]|uniref:Extracellular solute-binding protein n=1 Tax=Streptomyces purpurascens TaxID=1924 RepID=A0ABZ1MF96_STREF|nr:extracellular solute-binding protein [Streptomyces purpurascens]MCE7047781.1 extracellular solute-binding protein [Streptomyces purpurascens]